MKLYCHISVRHRKRDDTDMLLIGTPEEIAEHVASHVKSVLTNNDGASEIKLIPVPPYQVWDLEKQS